jgi:hypothetical protein
VKSPIKFALIAAIPLEALNFWLVSFPLDVGFPPDTPWHVKLIPYQWLVLHWPGVWLLEPLIGTKFEKLAEVIFVGIGYFDTVLLILVGILGVRLVRRVMQKYSAAPS